MDPGTHGPPFCRLLTLMRRPRLVGQGPENDQVQIKVNFLEKGQRLDF